METNQTTENTKKSVKAKARKLALAAALMATAALSFGAGGIAFGERLDGGPVVSQRVVSDSSLLPGIQFAAAVTNRGTAPRLVENGAPFSFADLVEHVSPAVVTVISDRETPAGGGQSLDDIPAPFRDFFRQFGQGGRGQGQGQGGQQQQMQRSEAMGSGFIIDGSGYIVTNNHVIEDSKKITVKMPNQNGREGREFTAHLVGTDKDTDVALLKVDGAKDLPTVEFGDDHRVRVGDWVVAVGNPFGLTSTVTAGIVSSIGRDIGNGPYTDFLQIDAPINQGNSGGPTFDLTGRVIGMNSAIYSPSGGSVGIGFAIPSSTVKMIVDQLRDKGAVTRGWLGVSIQSVTPDMAASLGTKSDRGAIVSTVISGSPAEKAGFKQGDVILSLNGTDVDSSTDLTRKVASLVVGQRANFNVLRDGAPRNLTAIIAKRDDAQVASNDQKAPARPGVEKESTNSALGLGLMPVNDDTRQTYNLDDNIQGVVISSVDPNSDSADKFRPGDVIVGMGNRDVRMVADVERGIADAKKAGRESVLFLVAGQGGQHYVAVKIAKG